MTVKIPMMHPLPREGYVGNHYATPAWKKFWGSIGLVGTSPSSVHSNKEIDRHLDLWKAGWLRDEGMLVFDTEEAATMWLLRWS